MIQISYLTFDLLIDRSADGFRARVLDSPVGEAMNEFVLPSVEQSFDVHKLCGNQPPKEFGAQLFNAVFDDEVLTCLRRSMDEATRQKAGLRILLRLSEVPELASLPWEYLYDERRRDKQRLVGFSQRQVTRESRLLGERYKALATLIIQIFPR